MKKRVRVIGFGHSPSDLCCTDDYMVRLFRFNEVLHVSMNCYSHILTGKGGHSFFILSFLYANSF